MFGFLFTSTKETYRFVDDTERTVEVDVLNVLPSPPQPFNVIGLRDALRKTASDGSGVLLMDSKDTTFLSYTDADIEDREVIDAVKSIPGHY